jgi:hypothetical protein
MNVDEVRAVVAAAAPRAGAIYIGEEADGKPGYDNVSCLLHRADGSWMVAYFERGSYHDVRVFDSESDACADFLEMLRLDPTGGSDGASV